MAATNRIQDEGGKFHVYGFLLSLPHRVMEQFCMRNVEQHLTTLYTKVLRKHFAVLMKESLMSLVVEALMDDVSGFPIPKKTFEDIPQSQQIIM